MMSESSNLHMKILSQHQRIYFSILVFQLTQKIGNLLYIDNDKVASEQSAAQIYTTHHHHHPSFSYNYSSYFIVDISLPIFLLYLAPILWCG